MTKNSYSLPVIKKHLKAQLLLIINHFARGLIMCQTTNRS